MHFIRLGFLIIYGTSRFSKEFLRENSDLNFIDANITCIVVIAVVQCFVVVKNEGIS